MDGSHVTWAGVVYALIVTLPAILAAVVGILNRRQLKPPVGQSQSLAAMVHDVHEAVAPNGTTTPATGGGSTA